MINLRSKRSCFILALMVYIACALYFAVLSRNMVSQSTIRLELFRGYFLPSGNGWVDVLLNIVCFIPLGFLVGLIAKRYRVLMALIVGLLMSLTIEFSQLIWQRGVFDLNDIFNNVVGSMIGGVMVVLIIWNLKTLKKKSDSLGCC